jgi:hypothetical protein
MSKINPEDGLWDAGTREGWIGVDLDGTLARWEKWTAPEVIGEPIPKMVARVKMWLAVGTKVKIVTARAAHGAAYLATKAWLVKVFGAKDAAKMDVTDRKDAWMHELWDDRAVSVERNTGVTLREKLEELEERLGRSSR